MSQPRLDLAGLRKMAADGCSAAELLAVIEAAEAEAAAHAALRREARREGNRVRQARLRHARRNGVTGGVTALRARANEIKELDITALRHGVTSPSFPFPPSSPKEVSPHTPLQEITPSSPFSLSPTPTLRVRAREKPKTRLKENFSLTLDMARYGSEYGFTGNACQALFDAFCDHHRANGSVFADWPAAWRTWVRNEIKFSSSKPRMNGYHHDTPRPGSREDTRERTQAALAAFAPNDGTYDVRTGPRPRKPVSEILPFAELGKP